MINLGTIRGLLVISFIVLACGAETQRQEIIDRVPPKPFEKEFRDRWLNDMHRTAPGLDWRQLEHQNKLDHLRYRDKSLTRRSAEMDTLADGRVMATWHERGSTNQAGRVGATLFMEDTEEIYLLAHGGTLWKGPLDGSNWNVVNDDFQFAFKSLRKSNVNGKTRLHTVLNKIPHYSDDLGLTWEAAEGMTTYDNNWGFRDELLNSADGSSYLMKVQEWLPQPWHQSVGIYHSRDYSESFNKIHDFGNIQRTEVAVSSLKNQNDFYVFCIFLDSGQQVVYKLTSDSNELLWLNAADTLSYPDGQVPFFAAEFSGQVSLYTYDRELIFYRSQDFGEEWTAVGILPDEPWLWAGGIFVSPSDPDFVLLGAQDCYKSENGGKTWMKINSWRDYYGKVESKLHADIMYFNEARNNDASTFHLISNDGGLSISYDNLKTTKNIALTNLNISEYYDCRTDLLDPQFIYAASQDQGFQRSVPSLEIETLPFNQVDGGDFGHITFSKDGRNLWTVYPGGLVYYYSDPQHSSRTLRWELESTNESVWLPPLAEHFDPDKILMAGGNVEGGEGSFLLELSIQADSIFAEQLPFDFKKDSGGEITAIEVSPLNDNLWYVATSNGLFYFSKDAGLTWDVSAQVGPAPQYLYGTVILASSINEDVVYFGGSGYSTAPVYRSDDSGMTFGQISKGLPPTLLIDLATNDDESMLFAACESGPYVYFQDDEQWYSILGESAPLQAWWSVEYLKKGSLVRFATHGRGIWDFQIHEVLSSEKATHDFYVTNVKLEVELVAQNEEVVIECDQYFEGRGNHQLIASTGFYLSKDTVFDQDDIRLALTRELIKEKNFIATSTKATIPDTTEPGEYYVMVVIDVNDQYGEANESNNRSWAMISVITEEAAHDFYMQNMHLEYDTVFIGEDLVVGIDQYFDGVGHHELLTFTGFYLSEDTIVDSTDIRLISTPRLIKEQVALNLTKSMTLPGSINEGSYFLIVYIDDGNLYPEVDEDNNQLWARLLVESMPTSVYNEVSQINFEAFPNPAVSHVYINSHWEDFKEYLWYDIHGRILDRGSISGPKIEVPQTVAGYILLQVSERKTEKIAVKKIFLDRK